MTFEVRHRGPDGEGYLAIRDATATPFAGPGTPAGIFDSHFAYAPRAALEEGLPLRAALGHRRLSIVDLSPAGHQPMCTEDQRYWIVYNGEIYNHIELRAELEMAGYKFCSHTDTEVILHAYREWGSDCLHRFNG
ncbi:MAG: asparagine synthase (glutamine-hydrolyzing), partial [Pyrinomonadaceae bacterium]